MCALEQKKKKENKINRTQQTRTGQPVGCADLCDARNPSDKSVGLSLQNWKRKTSLPLTVEDCTETRGQREEANSSSADGSEMFQAPKRSRGQVGMGDGGWVGTL